MATAPASRIFELRDTRTFHSVQHTKGCSLQDLGKRSVFRETVADFSWSQIDDCPMNLACKFCLVFCFLSSIFFHASSLLQTQMQATNLIQSLGKGSGVVVYVDQLRRKLRFDDCACEILPVPHYTTDKNRWAGFRAITLPAVPLNTVRSFLFRSPCSFVL